MGPTAILDDIVRKTQDIVRGALPPGRSREAAVVKLRELLLAREITAALAHLQRQLRLVRDPRKPGSSS
jgi:hypothetical protein